MFSALREPSFTDTVYTIPTPDLVAPSDRVVNTHFCRGSANTPRAGRHRSFPIRPGGHQFKQGMIYNDQRETLTV